MDINSILKGVNCVCGHFHSCDIERVYIEKDAAKRFKDLCCGYNKILIVADENTYNVGGESVERGLADKSLTKVIFSGSKLLIPDEAAIAAVEEKTDGIELLIGIGSGVIQDLCKYVSHDKNIPYMIFATAPSMDGYASSGAAMILKGMKVTVAAGVPKAIVADTKILKDAPFEMIAAGYGDIIGKYSALCDWKLSRAVNNEYFCTYIYDLTYKMIEKTLSLADGIIKRDEESIGVLTEALITVGILMSFAGSSRPASGSEHHLSHFFEITGILDDKEYFPHGIDVAYSTVITARLREQMLKKDFPDSKFVESKETYTEKMNEIYKSAADGCIQLQSKIGNYEKDRMSVYNAKKDEIRDILSEVPSGDKIEAMLKPMGFDMDKFYNMYGIDKIKTAVKYAKDLKDRYTVLWLNYDLFGGTIEI